MNEKDIMEKINEAVRPPESSFEDIRARIEAQSEEEREISLRETLEMTEIKERRTAVSAVRRVAAAAAAIAVTLGLGAALIAMSIGGVSMDSASSEAVMDEAIINDEADVPVCEESQEEPVIVETETTADNTSGENAAGNETPDTDQPVTESSATVGKTEIFEFTDSADFVTCRVDALDMSLALPSRAHITGRDVYAGFELLKIYGMSEAQLEANYKSRNIYYNAVWYDGDADVTEIVIAMTEDETSQQIFDLSKASEEQLAKIRELYLSYGESQQSVAGAKYSDVSLVENEQVLFVRASGMVKNRSGRSNHLQYMTIVNGMRIEITLIEHFGIDCELTGEEPTEVSQQHAALMDEIIGSVRFDKIKSNWLQENRGLLFYGLLFAAGIAAIVIVLLLPENRRRPVQNPEEEQEKADDIPVEQPTTEETVTEEEDKSETHEQEPPVETPEEKGEDE